MTMRLSKHRRFVINVVLFGTLILFAVIGLGPLIDTLYNYGEATVVHDELLVSSSNPSPSLEAVDKATRRISLVNAQSLAIPAPEDPDDEETSLFPCIATRIEHIEFPICIYSPIEDSVISGTFSNGGYFEADVVSKVIRHLREDRGLQFVDIGANLGTYTLPASQVSAGGVLAVEPNVESMTRLATSVVRGGVADKVDLVLAAVSSQRTAAGARMAFDRLNRGDSFLLDADGDCDDAKRYLVKCLERRVDTLLLNDLVPLMRTRRAVMKVDVQGHEIQIFTELAAGRFFDEVDVPLVLMEWEEYTAAPATVNRREVKSSNTMTDVEEFLKFFYRRRYVAFDTDYRMLPKNWTTWPNNIFFQKL